MTPRMYSAPDGTVWTETDRPNEHVELERKVSGQRVELSQYELDHANWEEL